MKNILTIAIIFFAKNIMAQKSFNNCTAAFLNNKMIVGSYVKDAKAKININASGILTVCTANISIENTKAVKPIPFLIGRKDKNTGTLTLFSNKIYEKHRLEEVLKTCKKGDKIVLITTNDQYALPHNEILVE